jgi:16S rRNA (cytidine1402-2'-O)-methyltransferase
LADIRDVLGNRHAVVARELTKKFEEVLRGDLDSLLKRLENRAIKGEITLLVEGHHE